MHRQELEAAIAASRAEQHRAPAQQQQQHRFCDHGTFRAQQALVTTLAHDLIEKMGTIISEAHHTVRLLVNIVLAVLSIASRVVETCMPSQRGAKNLEYQIGISKGLYNYQT